MSQFRTLSPNFKDALESLGKELAENSKKANKPSGLGQVRDFFDGPVTSWYQSLDENDRAEVDRLFGELNELAPEDVVGLMRAEKHASPFGLVGGLFRVAKK
jgi:hypothetical protein